MRLAIIGTRGYPYVYSGYETFVAEIAPRLKSKDYEVHVYCHRQLFRVRPKEVNGIKLHYIPSVETKILSQLSHSLMATIHALFMNFDIILYVNSANGPLGLLTKVMGKKTAINVDGLEWLRPKWKGLGAKYFRFASFLSTKLFDKIVTDSDRMAEVYFKEFGAKSTVIAYGAPIGESESITCLQTWGLSPFEYYLVVGRLIPDNNVDIIVKGFEICNSKRKLVILGDVPYKDEFAASVRNTKDQRIIFPGYIREKDTLKELYCNSFSYIHGHEYGGTNPSLLKALGYGCYVLALDTPFSREVLDNTTYGDYFQKSPQSLAGMIENAEKDRHLVATKRALAPKRIMENYTWEKIVDQYDELFTSVGTVHPLNRQGQS